MGALRLEYTEHALHVMTERSISIEWVEIVVGGPELRM